MSGTKISKRDRESGIVISEQQWNKNYQVLYCKWKM